ncbi:MAG TPA: DUF2442 domain-containing protein [Phototrophicaceae bacterium]|nr:DUF2442 domain-containing protein [Phototrophicaceae bacterium]
MMSNPFAYDAAKDRPTAVEIKNGLVLVTLADGRVIGNPLDWHPWLANASAEQQAHVELHHYSVDWPDLDEGLDIQGMLMGIHPKYPEHAAT